MLKVTAKAQFKKDLKKVESNPRKLKELKTVIDFLIETGTVPSEYKPHPLKGNWKPHMECHVLPDFLLIWDIDKERNELILTRCGSHSDLF